MVPRGIENNAFARFCRQTKSIMVFLKVANLKPFSTLRVFVGVFVGVFRRSVLYG